MEVYRYPRLRNKASNSLRMKASSLYFLNDISNIDSIAGPEKSDNWRDAYTFNPMIIGRGHFSKVYKVKCCSTGNNAAIKIIRRRRLGADKIDEIMQEIEIMQLLNKSSNSGFIQLLKVHTSPSEVGIVMEFAAGGSLYHVTQESKTGLPEVYVKIVLTKILSALSALHREDIVHLDIKADNILLRHPYQSTDVVLIDFGLARRLTKSKVHKEMIGTPDYIAPEVLNYEQICLKSDIWSVGVLAYFLLTNISPFSGYSKDDTLNRVTKTQFEFVGNLKEESMHLARDFISRLLVKIPDKRLSAEEGMSHDFLVNVPIVECPSDKSSSPKAQIINLEYQVRVRQNTSSQTRGMVMSQYDIYYQSMNRNSMTSDDDLLKANSVECLDSTNICGTYDNELIDVGMSLHSIDHICNEFENGEQIMIEEEDNDEKKMPIDSVICDMMESFINDIEPEETLVMDNTGDKCREPLHLPFVDYNDNFVCDMTTSLFEPESSDNGKKGSDNVTERTIYESHGVLIDNHELHNHIVDNNTTMECKEKGFFSKTAIYESRRRWNPLASDSFSHSREKTEDHNNNEERRSTLTHSCSTTDPSLLNTTKSSRRLHLSRSLKRDSDKPNIDKFKRRSHLDLTKNTISDSGTHDFQNGLTKFIPSLVTSKIKNSIDQINVELESSDRYVVEDDDNHEKKMPIDSVICVMMESYINDIETEETLVIENCEDGEPLTNDHTYDVCNECSKQLHLPFLDNNDNLVCDMTTSLFEPANSDNDKKGSDNITETTISESHGLSAKIDHYKDKHELHNPSVDNNTKMECKENGFFSKTAIYESRRRWNPLASDSFRQSREKIVDYNNNEERRSTLTHSCITADTSNLNTTNSRSGNGVNRRLHLSRSLKRDSDKPNSDRSKRRSQLDPIMHDISDGGTLDCHNNLTKSTPSLVTQRPEHKKSSSKFDRIMSGLKPKKNSQCVIS